MTKLRTMVQERFVGITSVLDRFATRQEQTNARLSYNESILNSKIDMLSSRFDKVGDTIMVQLYKSPLVKEVADMREHLEKGLVSLHSLQQDVADLGRRMSAFETDASVQLPRMVPFDNTWSAYNVKASPSVDRKDIIDIADDSYVTMRKKHSSSIDDGDGSLIINKGLEGYRHDVGMSGNAFTPDDGDVKPNSFVPVPEKNDDYDKLVSLYEEQRRSLLRLQDKLGLKGNKSVPADNFGRFVDDFGQQVNGPSEMKSQIPVDKVPSSPQGRSDPFFPQGMKDMSGRQPEAYSTPLHGIGSSFPQGMKDLSDRQPEVISTPLRGYDPSSPKVIEDMSGRLPEVGSSPSLKDA
ncbi:hypothetical protein FOZ60_014117, partial [Perkinsus olseni]